MNIGFIGPGKVGKAFGQYMKDHGHNLIGFVDKGEKIEPLLTACDLVFITTPDGVIESIIKEIASYKPYDCALGHMSGALTTDLFTTHNIKNPVFSLHPLQAFASVEKGRQDLKTCTFALEGNPEGLDYAKQLLKTCNNKVVELKSEQKALYHGAACVASNYMMAVTALAEEMIASFDPDGELGLEAYEHLMVGALKNAIHYGSAEALTGPIARGDISTVKTHLSAMDKKQMKKDYSTLGMMTVTLAGKSKLTDLVLKEEFKSLFKGVQENEK